VLVKEMGQVAGGGEVSGGGAGGGAAAGVCGIREDSCVYRWE